MMDDSPIRETRTNQCMTMLLEDVKNSLDIINIVDTRTFNAFRPESHCTEYDIGGGRRGHCDQEIELQVNDRLEAQ